MSTIEENKRELLLDMLNTLEDKFDEFAYKFEDFYINDLDLNEEKITINWLINQLKEEITFS